MNIPKLLKDNRERMHLTQKEVAKQLFVSRNTYTQYENGTRKIDTETFFHLVDILHIDITVRDYLQSDIRLRELSAKHKEWAQHRDAFFEAVKQNEVEKVAWFIENGMDADTKDSDGNRAFTEALIHDAHQSVSYLLDKGVPYYIKGENQNIMPLGVAVAAEYTNTAKALLTYGTDPNETTAEGIHTLWIAARTGNQEMFQLLMEHGADINYKTGNPITHNRMQRNVFLDAFAYYVGDSVLIEETEITLLPVQRDMFFFILNEYGDILDDYNREIAESLKNDFLPFD